MMLRKSIFAVAALTLACASASTSGAPRRDANLITKEEIAASNTTNAYDAINALRPAMFRFRGKTTINGSDTGYPRVYVDRQLYGDLESLKTFDVGSIRSIRYYNTGEAQTRFGLGNASGAIEIITDATQ